MVRLICFILGLAAGIYGVSSSNLLSLLATPVLLAIAFRGIDRLQLQYEGIGGKHFYHLYANSPALLALPAGAFSLLAAWIVYHDELNLAAAYLWAAALILAIISALNHDGITLSKAKPSIYVKFLAFRQPHVALETGLLILITLVAFALRVVDLDHYPPSMHGDEGEMGLLALQILGRTNLPFFGASPFFGLPYVFNYLQAVSMAIFGTDEAGLRMLSVVFGTFCIPLVYGIGRIGWGRIDGVVAAWLMAVSHLNIHYSRAGFIFIESVLGMLVFIFLLAKAAESSTGETSANRQSRPLLLYAGAGLAMGLSQYFDYSSRVMPIIALPLLAFLWLKQRATVRQIAVLWVAMLLAFAPLGAFFANHPEIYFERINTVSIFNTENLHRILGPATSFPADLPPLLAYQFEHILGLFINKGDGGGFYYQTIPAFDSITAVLLWLGLGIALTRTNRYHEFALLCWFGLGILFGGIFTIDAPSAHRLLIMTPAVYLFGGVFVARSWSLLTRLLGLRLEPAGIAVMGLGAILLLTTNYSIYFDDYAIHTQGLEAIAIARELSITPDKYDAYLMGTPILYTNHGVIRFVARAAHPHDLENPSDLRTPDLNKKGLLVIAVSAHTNDLKLIMDRYPGGTMTVHNDPAGRLVYIAYRIPPRR